MAGIRLATGRGSECFLVLKRDPRTQRHRILILASFKEVLHGWSQGNRVSPLYPLISPQTSTTAPTQDKPFWVVFMGPVNPGHLPGAAIGKVYLSFGLFNLVAFCHTAITHKAAIIFAQQHGAQWESWAIGKSGLIKKVTCSITYQPSPVVPADIKKEIDCDEPGLWAARREYSALMVNAFSTGKKFLPCFANDVHVFDRHFKKMVGDANKSISWQPKQAHIVTANAVVSRFVSQTFSGISPILSTECQYSPHSLLGIGIASLALLQIRRFSEISTRQARLPERIKVLASLPPENSSLWHIPREKPFWAKDHLDDSLLGSDATSARETLPAITCFSGRDGFRSTIISLSAPLELLTSCNTRNWTPLTITHEISHNIVLSILTALIPKWKDDAAFNRIYQCIQRNEACKNFLEQVQAYFFFGIDLLWGKKDSEELGSTATIKDAAVRHWSEIQEILAHCVDFQYFYRSDIKPYIHSIWMSWDAIPNIMDRIDEYLFRTLCAINVHLVGRPHDHTSSIDILLKELDVLAKDRECQYATAAYAALKRKRIEFEARLVNAKILITFSAYFMHARMVEKLMSHDDALISARSGREYGLRAMEFDGTTITNPLRFTATFSTDDKPDPIKSLWMMQRVAFADITRDRLAKKMKGRKLP